MGGRENGHFFHLVLLAAKQLSYEVTKQNELQPIDVEQILKIQLYHEGGIGPVPFGSPYERKPDITLLGNGVGQNVILEAKSKKRPAKEKEYSTWNFSKDEKRNKQLHKQFFLDRVAMTIPPIEGMDPVVSDIEWWFHDFHRTTIDGYNSNDLDSVYVYLTKMPKSSCGDSDVGTVTLGGNSTTGLRSKLKSFTVKNGSW